MLLPPVPLPPAPFGSQKLRLQKKKGAPDRRAFLNIKYKVGLEAQTCVLAFELGYAATSIQ